MKKIAFIIYKVLLVFGVLGVVFIPFSFQHFAVQSEITKFLFENSIVSISNQLSWIHLTNSEISSDSTALYVLLGLLFCSAIIIVSITSFIKSINRKESLIIKSIQLILTYYLSAVLLKYGFDKLFKVQFYLPEPNILYTPLGMLDKDILFWSTIGTSYSYTLFMGLMEIIPALMLLHNKTRILGLMLLLGVMINVVFINFGFDISVKLYTTFLLLLCGLLLVPFWNKLMQFFIFNQSTVLSVFKGKEILTSNAKRYCLKAIAVGCILMESLIPYLQNGSFNDDNAPRNPMHGSYEVTKIDTNLASNATINLNLKRLFIHRQNYFIIQYSDDRMEDFSLEILPFSNQFVLTNQDGATFIVHYKYSEASKILELKSADLGITITSKSIPWRELPLLKPLFHWTVDEI